jgi:sugar phosphate isomerase/epimerase
VRKLGYSAAYSPVKADAEESMVMAYADAAKGAGLVIAETGAWSNPLSRDEKTRREALELNRRSLDLAERIGARCCVNISGSRGEQWDGPHPDNLTDETFDLIVETVRGIIDAVKPKRTFYTLETMPWMVPDSAESYVDLVRAVDRAAFAVHFDPVNLVCTPRRYCENAALVREFVAKLGPHIKSCHAKDVVIRETLTLHIDEVRPGQGNLDYETYLRELSRLDPDLPLIMEHLKTAEEYAQAAEHIRRTAAEISVRL